MRPAFDDRKRREARAPSEVVALAWPIAIAMLGETAMGLVDTKLVAGLGAPALAGVGVASTLMWLCYSIVFGLMRGVKVRTAHALGEGREAHGVSYASAGLLLGALLGLLVWALYRDVAPLLVPLGIDASAIPYARDFLAARTYGAPSIAMVCALVQWRQGEGDARSPMIVGLLGNVVNAALAYGLIYGRFGLPALGVRGAGYGTACAETLQLLLLGWLLLRERRRVARSGVPRPGFRRAAADIAGLGVPTGMQFGAETLAFATFTAILGGIGADEVAAHQIALAVIRTSFLPGVAVAEAASVLVGRALGGSRLDEADRVAKSSVALAVSFMAACGLLFALTGGAIARLFTTDPAVATIARRLLLVAAVFQALDAVTIVLKGALRGAKDVRVVAAIGIAVSWCCVPGAAWVLGRQAGLGALGGWFGLVAETSISAVLFSWRWRRGGWRAPYRSAASAAVPIRAAVGAR